MVKNKTKTKYSYIKILEIILLCMCCIILVQERVLLAQMGGSTGSACIGNTQCPKKDFCEKQIGDCAGQGICTDKPRFCPHDEWNPVCGCDGNTYPNKCEAERRGINVVYNGQCSPGVDICMDSNACSPGSYCDKALGDCAGQGTCSPRPVFCAQIWAPVCGCDGNTYPNECEAAVQGINVLYNGECQPVGTCSSNSECSPDDYCQKTIGDCGGQGSCAPRPTICAQVWDPVCGCDGITYPNECEASAQGVNVDHQGECQTSTVGCTNNDDCSPNSFCQKTTGDCAGQGTCIRKPHMCPDIWEPVCGCDGNTYPNECEAAAQGISIDSLGECSPGPVGCTNNGQCQSGSYCQKNLGDCTGSGGCVPAPDICADIWAPVCGCNGETYPNECVAGANGINVDYVGECIPGTIPTTCTNNGACPTDSYCKMTDGNCIGEGICAGKPQACPQVWAPVCGCDGKTYPNECEAAVAGINVDYTGECAGTGPACIDTSNCPAGTVCQKSPGNCTGQGICAPPPDSCIQIWFPVCGCDGKTYANGCVATSMGVNVDYTGECLGSVITSCANDGECSTGFYCQKTEGDCQGQQGGTCVIQPDVCPEIWEPVCGCDGNTYPNECEAAVQGINVEFTGECPSGSSLLCQGNWGCPSFTYCQKETGQCTGGFGLCKPRPEYCIEVYDPVCGCDGKTYSNECIARSNGINVKYAGACKTVQPPPQQPWGGLFPGFGLTSGGFLGGFPYGGFIGGSPYGGYIGGSTYGGYIGGSTPYGGFIGGSSYGGFLGGSTYGGFIGGSPYGGYIGGSTYGGFLGGSTYGGFVGGSPYGGFLGGTTYGGFIGGSPYGGFLGGSTYGGFLGGSTYGGFLGGTTYGGFLGFGFPAFGTSSFPLGLTIQ